MGGAKRKRQDGKQTKRGIPKTAAGPATLLTHSSSNGDVPNDVELASAAAGGVGGEGSATLHSSFRLSTGNMITTGKPPSVVNVSSGTSTSISETSEEHQCKVWFENLQKVGRMDTEKMLKKDINDYVRYKLFPELKFIMNKTQLNYSEEKQSLCSMICTNMGMAERASATEWWEKYKGMIADILNAKRADVTGAIKQEFISKWSLCVCCRPSFETNIWSLNDCRRSNTPKK